MYSSLTENKNEYTFPQGQVLSVIADFNEYMLWSFNEECCINLGVCLNITPWFLFTDVDLFLFQSLMQLSLCLLFFFNMKQARPWMLANLYIFCQFHAHPVHQNSVQISWAEIYQGRLFLGSNLVSFNRTLVVPCEISKVNFHAEKKILVSMSEEI
jgi:hypothetical protein